MFNCLDFFSYVGNLSIIHFSSLCKKEKKKKTEFHDWPIWINFLESCMIRTTTTIQAEKYVHSLKCLDVWRGLKRTKHKCKTEMRTYITVSVYLSGSVYFCCVLKGNLSSDLGSKICSHRGSWIFICQRFTQRASETSSMLSAVIDKNSVSGVCVFRPHPLMPRAFQVR